MSKATGADQANIWMFQREMREQPVISITEWLHASA